jgi:hypothetical protein
VRVCVPVCAGVCVQLRWWCGGSGVTRTQRTAAHMDTTHADTTCHAHQCDRWRHAAADTLCVLRVRCAHARRWPPT